MPNIVLYIAQSIDGYIATPDGSVSWLDAFNTIDYGYDEFVASVDAVILGATTYTQLLTFGPYPYSQKKSIIYSSDDLLLPPTADCTILHTFSKEFYDQFDPSMNFWLVGGAKTIQHFTAEKMISEYRIFTMPILLGEGIPLFLPTQPQKLLLRATKPFSNGVVENSYTDEI